jgi:hypothetical protein
VRSTARLDSNSAVVATSKTNAYAF